MRTLVSEKVEVYLIRPRGALHAAKSLRNSEFLLLRRSPHRLTLSGVWQPVTGGIERDESAWQAAAREVLEETGLKPRRWWALEHLCIYYEPAADAIAALPVFVGELDPGAQPRLSDEHDAWKFASAAAARRHVLWDAQRHAIDAVVREVLSGRPGAVEREITRLIPAASRRAGHRAPSGAGARAGGRRTVTRPRRGS